LAAARVAELGLPVVAVLMEVGRVVALVTVMVAAMWTVRAEAGVIAAQGRKGGLCRAIAAMPRRSRRRAEAPRPRRSAAHACCDPSVAHSSTRAEGIYESLATTRLTGATT